jgi:hypothetical protein
MILVLAPSLGFADRKAGDACAAGLSPASRDIYLTTIAKNPTPSEARSVVIAEAEKLIAQGKLSMFGARSAGEAAGKCLQLIPK